jgi:hypothetical protein
MSTTHTPPAPAQTQSVNQVKIYSHSSLFYWWPVWAIGFILAILTVTHKTVVAVVPKDTELVTGKVTVESSQGKGETTERKLDNRQVLILPAGAEPINQPHLRISNNKNYGVLFAIVLMLVIVITNVPLRGMWSVMIIMLIILLSIIFALAGWWDRILGALKVLDIRINMGGYLFIALGLFIIWLVTFFLFDRQLYIIFQPGSFKVCLEVGGGEKQYDTIGMTIEKERSDLFRHWILGLGSGDMIVRTSGADRHEFRLNNVLFIGRKLHLVEEMQRVRQERSL